jgi:hypothetical protein
VTCGSSPFRSGDKLRFFTINIAFVAALHQHRSKNLRMTARAALAQEETNTKIDCSVETNCKKKM